MTVESTGRVPPDRKESRALPEVDRTLLNKALPEFIARQRWFAGKARTPTAVTMVDWAWVAETPHPMLTALVDVAYDDGGAERYHVPLVFLAGAAADLLQRDQPDMVVARSTGARPGIWCDALQDDSSCRALASVSRRDVTIPARQGTLLGRPIGARPSGDEPSVGDVERRPATHSNSVVMLGGQYVLKVVRRVEAGLSPDVEVGRFLAGHPEVRVPALFGSLDYQDTSGEVATLLLVQAFVPSLSTGWDHALADLGGYLGGMGGSDPSIDITEYLAVCATLGRRTADLHVALASGAADPAFAPEWSTEHDVRSLTAEVRRQADAALDLLATTDPFADEATASLAGRLLAVRDALIDRIETLGRLLGPFPRTRIHGDYHLGQVLLVEGNDFVILDFEGEPAKALAQRRAKHSPLRDVASMLRSWSYAADVGLQAAKRQGPVHADVLAKAARVWERRASGAFLRTYFDEVRGHGLLDDDPACVRTALDLFTLDKVVYELHYELNNRPDWVRIPLEGLLRLLEADTAADAGSSVR